MSFVATADEAYEIIQDRKKLVEYTKSVWNLSASTSTVKKPMYTRDLPYDDIYEYVENIGKDILSKIPESVQADLTFEHVGSTAIRGMPGAWHPDAAFFTKDRNPPKELVASLMENGFKFIGIGRLHKYDMWFVKGLTEGFLKDYNCKIHVTQLGGDAANCLQETRDRCRNEQWAFDSYKNAKEAAAKLLDEGKKKEYKIAKGNCEILNITQAKYNIKMPLDFDNLY